MLKIYDTLTKSLREFIPIKGKVITFYQCGPTVYSRQHIGNLFSAVKGDMVRRALEFLYSDSKVIYTRNITDVGHLTGENLGDADSGEDKLDKGAKKEGTTPALIAQKYTKFYHTDLDLLNVKSPTYETIATEYIKEMAEMVQNLIDKGYAYSTEFAIYFDVSSFENYTKLNRQILEKNQKGSGHGTVSDEGKRNIYDFAIWFFKAGEHLNAIQTWEYDFEGIEQSTKKGFPGWHIECSAMAKSTLGETIDIHMGGIEHIPTHHTNEIAQSECSNGVTFVNYWLHHELLMVEGTKMSKSLGNVYLIDDFIEKGYSALDYRYFLLQAHYRSKQNFTWDSLNASKVARERLLNNLSGYLKEGIVYSESQIDKDFLSQFISNLENDFNIPGALSIVWEVIKSNRSSAIKYSTIIFFDSVLGLNLESEVLKYIDNNKNQKFNPLVQSLIEERNVARKNRDFKKSDEIRDKLKNEFGIIIQDLS